MFQAGPEPPRSRSPRCRPKPKKTRRGARAGRANLFKAVDRTGKRGYYSAKKRCLLNERFATVAATGFGSGYAPLAPGTAGTIVAIPLYLVFSFFSWPLYLLSATAFTCLACLVSGEAEQIFQEKDSPRIVIDEMAGFLWTMFLATPTVAHVIAGFVLFRVFDIWKPFPARTIQDGLPGGYGIVGDDLVAGIYSNVALALLIRFFGF